MKKFFKTLSLVIIVLLLVFSLVFNYNVMTATADDSDTEDNSQYIDTRDYDLYQIDDVNSLATSELLEEVMNYPYLLDLLLYDDFDYGLRVVSEKYNGLRELLDRDNLFAELSSYAFRSELTFAQQVLISFIQSRDNEDYVETTVYTILNNPVYAIQYLYDLSSQEIDYINSYVNLYFPYVTKLREPTKKYNCHSYAWYDQSIYNSIWLPYPGSFKTDCYYPQTVWSAGDILVYVENGEDIHSAIIESTDGTLSGTIVISKWGKSGLYRHAANYSPYNSTNITAYRLCLNHTLTTIPYNIIVHQTICSNCSYLHLDSHTVNPLTGRCVVCGDRCIIIEPNNNEPTE